MSLIYTPFIIQAVHSQFFIKLYNKKLHYQKKGFNIEQETLRFEIKYRKMEKLNKIRIYNLQELIEYGVQNLGKKNRHWKRKIDSEGTSVV